jgi:hypothetical protein
MTAMASTAARLTDEQLGQGWLFHERFGYAYDKIPPGLAFEAYGKSLLMCASGDGTVSEDERAWVVGYFAAFDSPAEITQALKDFDDTPDFTRPDTPDIGDQVAIGDTIANKGRRWLVWDALNACSADGPITDTERSRVQAMGTQAGIEPEVIEQIFQLHQAESDLKKKRIDLLWPEGIPSEYL